MFKNLRLDVVIFFGNLWLEMSICPLAMFWEIFCFHSCFFYKEVWYLQMFHTFRMNMIFSDLLEADGWSFLTKIYQTKNVSCIWINWTMHWSVGQATEDIKLQIFVIYHISLNTLFPFVHSWFFLLFFSKFSLDVNIIFTFQGFPGVFSYFHKYIDALTLTHQIQGLGEK